MTKKRIIGIDPGTNVMGYAILDVEGNHAQVQVMGTVQMSKVPDHYMRLKRIFERTQVIINEFKPDEMAIEAPFFGVNFQSTIKLGRAQGICMAAALSHDIPVAEYAPMRVKQAITGQGNATKEQVALMLKRLLCFADMPKYLDATDALAIAYTHFLANRVNLNVSPDGPNAIAIPKSSGKSSSWADFIKSNPDRIKRS